MTGLLKAPRGAGGRSSWRRVALALAIAMVGAMAGCSTAPLPQETPKQAQAVANFDLNKCQELNVGLFKCPVIDKPLCNPLFDRSDVDCLRVGRKGELMIQQP
jgi:hypothetical protein